MRIGQLRLLNCQLSKLGFCPPTETGRKRPCLSYWLHFKGMGLRFLKIILNSTRHRFTIVNHFQEHRKKGRSGNCAQVLARMRSKFSWYCWAFSGRYLMESSGHYRNTQPCALRSLERFYFLVQMFTASCYVSRVLQFSLAMNESSRCSVFSPAFGGVSILDFKHFSMYLYLDVLIYICLTTKDEQLFISLSAICTFFLVRWLFRSFASFLIIFF